MSASYTINFSPGGHAATAQKSDHMYHQLAFKPNGGSMSGSLLVQVRGAGSNVFEDVPDGTIDLSNPKSLLFTFSVSEHKFTLTHLGGQATQLHITDSLPVNGG